jgi:hypothetical protein
VSVLQRSVSPNGFHRDRVSKPPSIAIVSPFIDRPCSDARKKAAAAISSAATARFMGITAMKRSRIADSPADSASAVFPPDLARCRPHGCRAVPAPARHSG